jgi:hypothetical protein
MLISAINKAKIHGIVVMLKKTYPQFVEKWRLMFFYIHNQLIWRELGDK